MEKRFQMKNMKKQRRNWRCDQMGKALRDVYGESLTKYAGLNEKVVALDADLANCSKTCMMATKYPDRVFDVGIAENNMIAMGAGFASSGFIPFVNTLCNSGSFHVRSVRKGSYRLF